ncbi:MAG: hypothetical protein ACI4XM_03915 [Candidatus Coprovivens sp.]
MNKIFEKEHTGIFVKVYEQSELSLHAMIDLLYKNDFNIVSVYVEENTDRTMKSVEGKYSPEGFKNKLSEIMKGAELRFNFDITQNDLKFAISFNEDCKHITFASETNCELEEILKNNNKEKINTF